MRAANSSGHQSPRLNVQALISSASAARKTCDCALLGLTLGLWQTLQRGSILQLQFPSSSTTTPTHCNPIVTPANSHSHYSTPIIRLETELDGAPKRLLPFRNIARSDSFFVPEIDLCHRWSPPFSRVYVHWLCKALLGT
ncbi:hypothetical protein GN956_G6009 [Arapaima gigas]